jgi:hypothetical protein
LQEGSDDSGEDMILCMKTMLIELRLVPVYASMCFPSKFEEEKQNGQRKFTMDMTNE